MLAILRFSFRRSSFRERFFFSRDSSDASIPGFVDHNSQQLDELGDQGYILFGKSKGVEGSCWE